MRIYSFENYGTIRWGIEASGQLIDFMAAEKAMHYAGELIPDPRSFLETGEEGRDRVRKVLSAPRDIIDEAILDFAEVRLLAPIQTPGKFIGIGMNYADHCAEQGTKPPRNPILFAKFANSIIGSGRSITIPRGVEQVDYEGELAVVIGSQCRRADEAEAARCIAGYTICNDVSAREIQFGDGQWTRGKAVDTFAPMGPCLVTSDEIPDPQNLPIRTFLNGERMQNSNTRNMIFSCAFIVSFLSHTMTLEPGDLISTGTPPGVGNFRKPPRFLGAGDVVEIEIEGIGRLTNPVRVEE